MFTAAGSHATEAAAAIRFYSYLTKLLVCYVTLHSLSTTKCDAKFYP